MNIAEIGRRNFHLQPKIYLVRRTTCFMTLFAFISEIPFDLAIFGKNEGNLKEKDSFDSYSSFMY